MVRGKDTLNATSSPVNQPSWTYFGLRQEASKGSRPEPGDAVRVPSSRDGQPCSDLLSVSVSLFPDQNSRFFF